MKNYIRVMKKTANILFDLDFKELNFKPELIFNSNKRDSANYITGKVYLNSIEDYEVFNIKSLLSDYINTFMMYTNDIMLIYKLFTTAHEIGHIYFSTLIKKKDMRTSQIINATVNSFNAALMNIQNYKLDTRSIDILQFNHRIKHSEAFADCYAISRLPIIFKELSRTRSDIKFKILPSLKINKNNLKHDIDNILFDLYKLDPMITDEKRLKMLNQCRLSNEHNADKNIVILEDEFIKTYLKTVVDKKDIKLAESIFYIVSMYSIQYIQDYKHNDYILRLIKTIQKTTKQFTIGKNTYNKDLSMTLVYNIAFTMFPVVWKELIRGGNAI